MRLSVFSDYSFRVLMYAATKDEGLVTTAEVSDYFRISYNHLVKVVHRLSSSGFLSVQKGKGGGFRLSRDPVQIRLGDVLRAVEPDFFLVECHGKNGFCVVTPFCQLKREIDTAFNAFIAHLDSLTIADMVRENRPQWHSRAA